MTTIVSSLVLVHPAVSWRNLRPHRAESSLVLLPTSAWLHQIIQVFKDRGRLVQIFLDLVVSYLSIFHIVAIDSLHEWPDEVLLESHAEQSLQFTPEMLRSKCSAKLLQGFPHSWLKLDVTMAVKPSRHLWEFMHFANWNGSMQSHVFFCRLGLS